MKDLRPVEIDQFLVRVDEDAILPTKQVFRDRNFATINKWYKGIKSLKNPPESLSRFTPPCGLIRLKDTDYLRFNKILQQDLKFLTDCGVYNYSLSVQIENVVDEF